MKNFRDIQVWEKAHSVTLQVYALTRSFPKEEQYGLCSQMRRSASSIPTNIAEGCGRTDLEFARFLEISIGSANELDYQLFLSKELGYLTDSGYLEVFEKIIEIQKMLASFVRKIRSAQPTAKDRFRDSAFAKN